MASERKSIAWDDGSTQCMFRLIFRLRLLGPCNYQKALSTGKHFYLPKITEKTHARRGLYALWITILCVLDNKDVYMWQEKVYDTKT